MTKTSPLAWRALLLATVAFAANFSVWTLYAALGADLYQRLNLSAAHFGLLLSVPIFSGAILRLPVGFLTQRYSSRHLLGLQMLLVAPALFLLPYAKEFSDFMWLGLWLGVSGTAFVSGLSYVNPWFSSRTKGFALGVFGAGYAGAAISLLLIPFLLSHYTWQWVGPLYGIGLIIMALVFIIFSPVFPQEQRLSTLSAQNKPTFTLSYWALLGNLMKQHRVWRLGLYYYFVFGGCLALILWLPHYYRQAYDQSLAQAVRYTVFFVATSSMAQVLGGWLADKYGGRIINWGVFWISLCCLFFLSYPPTHMTINGIEKDVEITIAVNIVFFTGLIFIMGIAQGVGRAAVFKIINDYYPNETSAVGGFVGMLGALGGCTLPILFGAAQDFLGIASACFMVLYGVLALCMMALFWAIQHEKYQTLVKESVTHNFLRDE